MATQTKLAHRYKGFLLIWLVCFLYAAQLQGAPLNYSWKLPVGFPEPLVPSDNPMSDTKVDLGRLLFHDNRLSSKQEMSCATCHKQSLAFTDGLATPTGESNVRLPRNAMALINLAYRSAYGWANNQAKHLEQQIEQPLFSQTPIEMGVKGNEQEIVDRLKADPIYSAMFATVYPDDKEPVTWPNIIKALTCYERTLISGDSRFDRWLFLDQRPTDAVVRGLFLFSSERLGCSGCHGGIGFNSDFNYQNKPAPVFHFTGLTGTDEGLAQITGKPQDRFLFKTPTLRNIEVTAPYMHDGRFRTLTEVINHYAKGPAPEHGLPGFVLTEFELAALIEFLNSLTDDKFLQQPE